MKKKKALKLVKTDGLLLNMTGKWNRDKEVVLTAIKNNTEALKYASEKLKNDKEVILAAVTQNGWALRYTSENLKNNKELKLLIERFSYLDGLSNEQVAYLNALYMNKVKNINLDNPNLEDSNILGVYSAIKWKYNRIIKEHGQVEEEQNEQRRKEAIAKINKWLIKKRRETGSLFLIFYYFFNARYNKSKK